MNTKQIIEALDDQELRIAYLEHDFPLFFMYHFGWEGITDFHNKWLEDFESGDDLLLVAFRASRKTTIARAYCVWCIAYAKEPYIIVQSFEDSLSSQWVRAVAKLLMIDTIVADYGQLFPFQMKREDISKASFSDFESVTGVKIESKSLSQTTRGANMPMEGIAQRPTLLILDDIDIDKSTRNVKIIDQNYDKIRGETISSLDPTRRRIIFLGNVIRPDGIVPRFRKDYPTWRQTWQPLIEDGVNIWPGVFTDEVVEKLKSDGTTSFNQNYLLVPQIEGETIITRADLRFATSAPPGRIVFGIDPAFSLKTNSDSMALTITCHVGVQKYIIASYEFTGANKDEEKFCIAVDQLYKKHGCKNINVEKNNGGEIIGRMLSKRQLAVTMVSASTDKVTRLREHQGAFERGEVFFLPGTEKLQEQLLAFPNVVHDDMCLVGNTLIETRDGPVPIKNVKSGDYVLTRLGYRKVLKSFCTGMKDVKRVDISGGASLIGTGNHPVYVRGKGFVPIDRIVYGNIIEKCLQYKNTTGSLSETTPKANRFLTGNISRLIQSGKRLLYTCIGISGKNIIDLSLKTTIYTISTGTLLIMKLKIWNVLKNQNTADCIGPKSGGNNLERIGEKIIRKCKRQLSCGENQKRGGLGIDNTQSTLGRTDREYKKCVQYAERNMSQSGNDENSADGIVLHRTGVIGKRKVYNLEVEDCHEYFANGILVHNCDSMVHSFIKGSTIVFASV